MLNIQFNRAADEEDIADEYNKLLVDSKFLCFFSRGESVVAMVKDNSAPGNYFYWVWVSGNGINGESEEVNKIASTLASGEWKYQPKAKLTLEEVD